MAEAEVVNTRSGGFSSQTRQSQLRRESSVSCHQARAISKRLTSRQARILQRLTHDPMRAPLMMTGTDSMPNASSCGKAGQ